MMRHQRLAEIERALRSTEPHIAGFDGRDWSLLRELEATLGRILKHAPDAQNTAKRATRPKTR